MSHTRKFALFALGLVGCQTQAAAEVQATPAQPMTVQATPVQATPVQATPAQADVQHQAQACDVVSVRAALVSGMAGAQLDVPDAAGMAPLALAARAGCLPVVIDLVGGGADIERVDASGWSALHHASSQRHADVVDYLLAHGAEQERKTANGDTPLALALVGSRSQFGPQGDGHTTEMVLLSGRARARLNLTPLSHASSATSHRKKPTAKKRATAKPAIKPPSAKKPAATKPAAKKPATTKPAAKKPATIQTPRSGT